MSTQPTEHARSATVAGAGVSGLTTAMCLVEAGWHVRVFARERHPDAVSSVAAAIWTMTSTRPTDRTRPWALESWRRFDELVSDPATGVVRLRQIELERRDPGPLVWEHDPQVRRLPAAETPDGYEAAFEIDGFMVEPPIYLDWLSGRVTEAGVDIVLAEVDDLASLDGDVVVNCTGAGAADLAGDSSMYPIRGQVVRVANPGIRDGIADESDQERVSYVYPRSTEIVLGGQRDEADRRPEPDPALRDRILADAAVLDPRIAGLEVVAERVGFRPGRPEVRVELDRLSDGRPLVHNYGHSGAGFILSWGCAAEVVELAGASSHPGG